MFCIFVKKTVMERIIMSHFLEWGKSKNRKPLIVKGARQVGKSHSIVEFGKNFFSEKVLVVNFEKQPDWHNIFEQNLDAKRIVSELEIVLGSPIEPGKTLLFFDEIQDCKNAILSLRYFYEQLPELHIIAAGSLLDFALEEISFPVGRVQLMQMHPMNFYEFLLATKKKMIADLIIKEIHSVSESIDDAIKQELKKYFFVGGMPECVKTFAETQSFLKVSEVQNNLIETFRQDFSKYAGRTDRTCLLSVLKSVAQKTGEQIKYSDLAEGFSNPTIKKSFDLLETAKLFHKVQAVPKIEQPLGANVSSRKFKSFMLDIGLLSRISGLTVPDEYLKHDIASLFRGKLGEQFVGQEFLSAGQNNLYYWARDAKNSNAEIDMILQKGNKMIPVEVKSGSSGKLKSLHMCLQAHPNIEFGAVLSDAAYGINKEHKTQFIPMYFAFSFASESKE
jgi:uncharacterized protein